MSTTSTPKPKPTTHNTTTTAAQPHTHPTAQPPGTQEKSTNKRALTTKSPLTTIKKPYQAQIPCGQKESWLVDVKLLDNASLSALSQRFQKRIALLRRPRNLLYCAILHVAGRYGCLTNCGFTFQTLNVVGEQINWLYQQSLLHSDYIDEIVWKQDFDYDLDAHDTSMEIEGSSSFNPRLVTALNVIKAPNCMMCQELARELGRTIRQNRAYIEAERPGFESQLQQLRHPGAMYVVPESTTS